MSVEQHANVSIHSSGAEDIDEDSEKIFGVDHMRPHRDAVVSATGLDDIVRLLLGHGAEINHREHGIDTLLATSITQGKRSTAKILLESGADVHIEDAEGHNIALEAALGPQVRNSEAVISLLFKHGAKVKPEAHAHFLHLAATRKKAKAIRIMVLNGIDVNAKDRLSRTALHALVECISHYAGSTLETAQTLLDLDLDVNAHGGEYDTALIAAAALWHADLVRLLLGRGANASFESQEHGTALDAVRAPPEKRYHAPAKVTLLHKTNMRLSQCCLKLAQSDSNLKNLGVATKPHNVVDSVCDVRSSLTFGWALSASRNQPLPRILHFAFRDGSSIT